MSTLSRLFQYALLLLTIVAAKPALALAANRDVCPSCTYHTIYDALQAALDGDTIRVAGGAYEEGIYFDRARSLRAEGGYSSDMSERDPERFPTVIRAISVSYYHSGDASVDGFTVTGSSSQGVVAWAPNSSLTINNCKIYNHSSAGIYILAIKWYSITNCKLWNNGSYASIYVTDDQHTSGVVADNEVWGSTCQYCSGISLQNVHSGDIIARNIVHDSLTGINLRLSWPTTNVTIEWNKAYSNSGDGFHIMGGNPSLVHNLSYNNGGSGFVISYGEGGNILHNISYNNGDQGMYLVGYARNGSRVTVKNNVFGRNQHGLNITGSIPWGSTSLQPDTQNNVFFANTYSELVHGSDYPWAFEDEAIGSYGELNGPAWSKHNVKLDPHFVDPDNGNFSLQADSFLVDEGDPNSDYSGEPAPNGSRVNIGLWGNTSVAEHPAEGPLLQNLGAVMDGDDLHVTLDTDSNVSDYWVDLEYQIGSSFFPVPVSQLQGDDVVSARAGARISSGAAREIVWRNALTNLTANGIASAVRATLRHGLSSDSASAALSINCSYSVDQTEFNIPASGGIVDVNMHSDCAAIPSSDADWAAVENQALLRDAAFQINVAPNRDADQRSTTVSVGSATIFLTQDASIPHHDEFVLGPDPTPSPTSTVTPIYTRTPTPSATPTRRTAAPPTPIPTATATPQITPNPTPQPTHAAPERKRTPKPTPTPRKAVKKKLDKKKTKANAKNH